ncbi:MAG: PfkB family carbohydrate kinase [Chloroflexota bacterium]
MPARVIVVGSINVDLVVAADRLPQPGETVLGGRFTQSAGGKGANAAVAAARAGASVTMIGAVGDDAHGRFAIEALIAEGVDTAGVRTVAAQTGVALIAVGPRGENQITVAPGANALVTSDALRFDAEPGVLIANFEIPLPVVVAAVEAAHAAEWTAIVDPAPAHAIPAALLAAGPILLPNEHELTVAIGNDDASTALDELMARHVGRIIVTQGAAGVLLAEGDRRERFPGYPAPAVLDSTGAGDAFCGVLATWLAEGATIDEAIDAANAAAALSVAQVGARAGMPSRTELDAFRKGELPAR